MSSKIQQLQGMIYQNKQNHHENSHQSGENDQSFFQEMSSYPLQGKEFRKSPDTTNFSTAAQQLTMDKRQENSVFTTDPSSSSTAGTTNDGVSAWRRPPTREGIQVAVNKLSAPLTPTPGNYTGTKRSFQPQEALHGAIHTSRNVRPRSSPHQPFRPRTPSSMYANESHRQTDESNVTARPSSRGNPYFQGSRAAQATQMEMLDMQRKQYHEREQAKERQVVCRY